MSKELETLEDDFERLTSIMDDEGFCSEKEELRLAIDDHIRFLGGEPFISDVEREQLKKKNTERKKEEKEYELFKARQDKYNKGRLEIFITYNKESRDKIQMYKDFEIEMTEMGIDPDYWCDHWDDWEPNKIELNTKQKILDKKKRKEQILTVTNQEGADF